HPVGSVRHSRRLAARAAEAGDAQRSEVRGPEQVSQGALRHRTVPPSLLLAALALAGTAYAHAIGSAPGRPRSLAPSGIRLTPTAAAGATFVRLHPGLRDFPRYVAGQAVTTATSPDGKTLLVLTSGYNQLSDRAGRVIPADSAEYVFVYDISHGRPESR